MKFSLRIPDFVTLNPSYIRHPHGHILASSGLMLPRIRTQPPFFCHLDIVSLSYTVLYGGYTTYG